MTLLQENRTLLDAFRRGEEAALREVYYHYVKLVGRFVGNGWYNPKNKSRACGIMDFDVQSELVQEVFMQAFMEKARLAYDGIRPYRLFLLGIARNTIVKYIRGRPKDALSHAVVELDNDEFSAEKESFLRRLGEEPVSAEEDIDWRRCVDATEMYIADLDSIRKQFVDLRFRERLPLVEVARKMRITRGKARFLEKDLGRGLKRFLQSRNVYVNFT